MPELAAEGFKIYDGLRLVVGEGRVNVGTAYIHGDRIVFAALRPAFDVLAEIEAQGAASSDIKKEYRMHMFNYLTNQRRTDRAIWPIWIGR